MVADGRRRRGGRRWAISGSRAALIVGGLPGADHPAQPVEPLDGDARERARRDRAHPGHRDRARDRDGPERAAPRRSCDRCSTRPRRMPAFVYLIPAVALFLPSRFTAIVAAVIFAVPPVIRLVEVGIRVGPVRRPSRRRPRPAPPTGRLLFKVQLPMSRRHAAARGQPGHRHGAVDGGHRRTGRRGRARLRRHHRVLPVASSSGRDSRQVSRSCCSGSCSIGSPRAPAADDGRRQRGPAGAGAEEERTDMREHRIGRWLSGMAVVAIVVSGCARGSGDSAPPASAAAPSAAASAAAAGSAAPSASAAAAPATCTGAGDKGDVKHDDQPVGRRRGQRRRRPVPAPADGLQGHDRHAGRGGRLAGLRHGRGRRHPRELGPSRSREEVHHRQEARRRTPGRTA